MITDKRNEISRHQKSRSMSIQAPTNRMSTVSAGLGNRPKEMGSPSIKVNRTKNNNTQIFGQNTDKAATTRNNEGTGFS